MPRGHSTSLRRSGRRAEKWCTLLRIEADFDLDSFSSNKFEMEWPPRSGRQQSFPEVDQIAYFSLAVARRKILPGQRPFIEELTARLKI